VFVDGDVAVAKQTFANLRLMMLESSARKMSDPGLCSFGQVAVPYLIEIALLSQSARKYVRLVIQQHFEKQTFAKFAQSANNFQLAQRT